MNGSAQVTRAGVSLYRIHATIGDCFYWDVCFADDEVTARQIGYSMFGAHAHVVYDGEMV